MKGTDLMRIVEYKGVKMGNIRESWLQWFWGENIKEYEKHNGGNLTGSQHEIMQYIEQYI